MKKILYFLLCCLLLPRLGIADTFEVSGFLSVGVAKNDIPNANFWAIDNKWSLDNDTVLGLQIESALTDSLSLTAQGVMRGFDGYDDKYQPKIDWMYLSYQLKPGLTFRTGRMGLPWYSRSDYIEVGAAYPWVRPPVDVYGPLQFPIRTFDGVDLLYQAELADGFIGAQLFYGRYKAENNLAKMDSDKTWGGNVNYFRDAWTFSLSLIDTRLDMIFPLIAVALEGTRTLLPRYPGLKDVEDVIGGNEFHYTYWSTSVGWEPENWLIHSELYYIDSNDPFTIRNRGAFVSIAKPIDYLTPYFVLGINRTDLDNDIAEMAFREIGVPVVGSEEWFYLAGLSTAPAINRIAQVSYAAGLRYDLTENVDIKCELLLISPRRNTRGTLTYYDFTERDDENVRVYSIVVDMTF